MSSRYTLGTRLVHSRYTLGTRWVHARHTCELVLGGKSEQPGGVCA